MMRRAAKRDISEPAIVQALEQSGATVFRLDRPVDLLIGYRGRTYIAECKTGRGKLNANQVAFIEAWKGNTVPVLRTVEDAVDFINERAHDD